MKGPRIFASRLASIISGPLVLGGLIGGALADAQSEPPATASHLLVVPDTAEGVAALARTDARVVATYESFALVEAAGADDERLRRAGADRRDDMRTVRTAAGAMDPKSARSSLAGKELPSATRCSPWCSSSARQRTPGSSACARRSVRIVTYQPENSYVVHASGDEVDRLAALVGSYAPVRAVASADRAGQARGAEQPDRLVRRPDGLRCGGRVGSRGRVGCRHGGEPRGQRRHSAHPVSAADRRRGRGARARSRGRGGRALRRARPGRRARRADRGRQPERLCTELRPTTSTGWWTPNVFPARRRSTSRST